MGLTFVTREDGSTGYEYLNEEQTQTRGLNAGILPSTEIEDPSGFLGQINRTARRTVEADKDDNILVGTLKTPLRGLHNAAVPFIQETSDSIRGVAEWAGVAPEGTATTEEEQDKPIIGLGGWKPVKADNSEAWNRGLENLGTGVTQFALEWIALSKVLKGANFALKASKYPLAVKAGEKFSQIAKANPGRLVGVKSTRALKPVVGTKGAKIIGGVAGGAAATGYEAVTQGKGMMIDAFGFDPWDGNLITMASNTKLGGWIEDVPGFRDLIVNPDDTEAERRAKHVGEGLLIDLFFGGALKTVANSVNAANLAVGVAKAKGYAKQLEEAVIKFGVDSPEAIAIREKIVNQGDQLAKNPLVKYLEGQKYQAPEIPLSIALKNADKNQPLALFLRTAPFEDQAHIAIGRLEEALSKFADPQGRGPQRRAVDTVGDFVNLLNLARVVTEEGVQKALRDVNDLFLPAGQKAERKLLIGVEGYKKRMDGQKIADNLYYSQGLGTKSSPAPEVPTPVETKIPVEETVPTTRPDGGEGYTTQQLTNDLTQLRADLKALGAAPPEPPKGKKLITTSSGRKQQTPEYKKFNAWRQKANKIQKQIDALESQVKESADYRVEEPLPETRLTEEQFQTKTESTGKEWERTGKDWEEYERGRKPGQTWEDYGAYDDINDRTVRGFDKIKRYLVGDWKTMKILKGSEKSPAAQAEIESVVKFMETIGTEFFNDVGLSVRTNMSAKGEFNFLNRLVKIRKDTLLPNKLGNLEFQQTAIHEFWHTLSRYLPEKRVKQLVREFKLEKAQYKASLNAEQLADFNAGKFDRLDYRYKNIDEYFAESMLDAWWNYKKGAAKQSEGELAGLAGSVVKYFNHIWTSISAEVGLGASKEIFNDFMNKRYKGMQRTTKISSTPYAKYMDEAADGSKAELPDFSKRDEAIDADPNRPGETGPEVNVGETERILENYADSLKAANAGDEDLLSAVGYAIQDVINVRSAGRNKTQYVEAGAEAVRFMKAITDFRSRAHSKGVPDINMRALETALLDKAYRDGINIKQVEENSKILLYAARNVKEFASRIFDLRLTVGETSRQAGVKAANVLNAMNNGQINWNKAVKEMEYTTQVALKYIRFYQDINKSMGQQFKLLQMQVGDTSKIDFIDKPVELDIFKQDLEEAFVMFEEGEVGAGFEEIFGDDVITALKTGKWPAGTKSQVAEIADAIATSTRPDGPGIASINKITKGPNIGEAAEINANRKWTESTKGKEEDLTKLTPMEKLDLFIRSVATWKTSSILSAGTTYAVQAAVPYTRALMEPAVDLFNHSVLTSRNIDGRKVLMPFDAEAFSARLPITYTWYKQLFLQHQSALRLARDAFRDGHTYFDAYRHPGSFDLNDNSSIAAAVRNAEGKGIKLDPKQGAYDLNQANWLRSTKWANSNPTAIVIGDMTWKLGTFDLRAQSAIETFQKSLVGNSYLTAIGVGEGLEQAQKEGLRGLDKWAYAEEWAKAKVDFFTHDAIVNGRTIPDAINSHPAALKVGRMLTFTDDIKARMEHRSFSFGQELARQSGIDPNNFDEINKFAQRYIEGTNDMAEGWQYGLNKSRFSKSLRGGDTTIPKAGDTTPALTGAWSFLPSIWAKLQRQRMGGLATMVQPFTRSPADIMKQAARTIPGLNLTVDTFYRDVFDESSFFSNHWKGEVATSLVAGTVLWSLFQDDNIQVTGSGPLNNESRTLWTGMNMRPMSIRHKYTDENGVERWSEWLSYRAYEPVATLWRTAADIIDLTSSMTYEDQETVKGLWAFNVAGEVIKGNLQSTYYQGILDFMDDFVAPLTGIGNWGKAMPQPGEGGGWLDPRLIRYFNKQIISSGPHSARIRALTQMIDPVKRVSPGVKVGQQVIDPNVGRGEAGWEWSYEGDSEQIGGTYPYKNKFGLIFVDKFINDLKQNTPFWSKTLPVRRNWVTGDPLYNPGFLHDDQMPLDDEPWLSQLTHAFVLTHLPIAYSAIPVVGALPQVTGRTGHNEIAERNYVTRELMRLRGFGTKYAQPRPDELQEGVTLSNDAYNQYLTYINRTPDPITGLTLSEELFQMMNSDNYLNQDPDRIGDEYLGSARQKLLEPIFLKFKQRGKWLFFNDPGNVHALEVLEKRAEELKVKGDRDFSVKFGVPQTPRKDIKAGTKKRVSATEYIQSVQ